MHLNLTRDNANATPIVYAGGANLNPQYTLSQVLDALNKKVNPENETPSECAVVFLNYVNDVTSNVSTWLSAVMNSLNSWNNNHKTTDGKDILTKIDGTTTMGAVRGKIAVIINLRTTDKPSGTAPVNYINNFSTSVQNTDIVSAPYSSGATVRIQNLQQCNNPSFSDGGGYAYRDKIGVIPYFIAVKNHDDSKVSCNLLDTKKKLMKKLNQEIAEGGTDLYINDLSGFCVTKNRESTGYARYGTVRYVGWRPWWDDENYAYDYKDFTGYTVVKDIRDLDMGWDGAGHTDNVCLDMAEIGNGGNTCLFAQEFNDIAVNEYSSMIGDLRHPLGIVLMNFAGVAEVTTSTNKTYMVQGIRLPGLIMMNNFMFPLKTGTTTTKSSDNTTYTKGGDVWD